MCDFTKLSKEVYQFDGFSFYHFREQPNTWNNHSHQEFQITLPQANAQAWIDCSSDKNTRQIKAGHSFLIAPGQVHSLDWQYEAELTLFYFQPRFFADIVGDYNFDMNLEIDKQFSLVDDGLIRGIASIFTHLCSSNSLIENIYVESLGNLLATHLLKKYIKREKSTLDSSDKLSSKKLALISEYIEANIDCKITLQDLASICGVGKFYFCRLFKKSTGIAPYQYVLQRRIEKAKTLLKSSDMPVSEISYDCGFSSQSHLTKHFKAIVKTSPTKYRQQIRF